MSTHDESLHPRARDGKFAAKQVGEATGITLESVQAHVADLERDLAAHRALAHRLAAYDRLKDLPADHTVSTLVLYSEPNSDGTFDVELDTVYDAEGDEVLDLIAQPDSGAAPLGWYDDSALGYRTAFDTWRADSSNPDSDIEMARVHAWYADLAATPAVPTDSDEDHPGSGWGSHRPVAPVTSLAEVQIGEVLAVESDPSGGARNLLVVTYKRQREASGTVIHGHFVDPADLNRKRLDTDGEVAVWDFEIAKGGFYATGATSPRTSHADPQPNHLADPGTVTPATPYGTTRVTMKDPAPAPRRHLTEQQMNEAYGV